MNEPCEWCSHISPAPCRCRASTRIRGLEDLVVLALPYVEMAEHDAGYKPGAVLPLIKKMRSAVH